MIIIYTENDHSTLFLSSNGIQLEYGIECSEFNGWYITTNPDSFVYDNKNIQDGKSNIDLSKYIIDNTDATDDSIPMIEHIITDDDTEEIEYIDYVIKLVSDVSIPLYLHFYAFDDKLRGLLFYFLDVFDPKYLKEE